VCRGGVVCEVWGVGGLCRVPVLPRNSNVPMRCRPYARMAEEQQWHENHSAVRAVRQV